MMRILTGIIAVALFVLLPDAAFGQSQNGSFDDFRKSVFDDYNGYRQDILSQYGKYLDSLWVEYPQYAGVERNPLPKPKDIPVAKDNLPLVQNEVPPTPGRTPVVGDTPLCPDDNLAIRQRKGTINIPFYGLGLSMRDVDYTIPDGLSRSSVSSLWKYMDAGGYHEAVIAEIRRLSEQMNLNDYLIFELTRNYVDAKFINHTVFSRNALTHFLLVNMGYDIRLAEAESGTSLLLLPFNQMVYARPFLNIDKKRYFVFGDAPLNRNESIYTCYLPSNRALGESFELKLGNLSLPYKPYKYNLEYAGIKLSGEVNANIFPILYRYPQMPIGDYARSVVSDEVRSQVVGQLKEYLENDNTLEKAERLLHFSQFAFDYATDDESHGFEKPYFFEEILYYPKCDCEDRAIFYSYLLYHVAGVENHIISYPGHEATALTLPTGNLSGTSYLYDGKQFFISDPTYVGASTGMCMPAFETVKPIIDYIYE